MADSSQLTYGSLGKTDLPGLLNVLFVKNLQISEFGWGKRGAGGTYSFSSNNMQYQTHRAGVAGIQSFPFDGQINYGNNMPLGCASQDVQRFLQENILCPFWFFDWSKAYLAILRANQPAFDAPIEAKLVWATQVAWVLNAALGSTNLHGSVLPSALYEHVTGNAFDSFAGDGSYMYTAQHASALPNYWKDAWNEAAKKIVASVSGDVLLDSSFKVFDRTFKIRWESAWHGSLFATPLETARFRYDPPIQIGVNCERISGRCDNKTQGIAGTYYSNTIENDPYVVRSSNGIFATDPLLHTRYQMWSAFIPWVTAVPFGGTDSGKASQYDPHGESMLAHTLAMATLFSPGHVGVGDASFWRRLEEWNQKEQQTPALLQTGARVEISASGSATSTPLYTPNHELSFRYYYPAMIDLVLACDYYGLVKTGINTWFKYNIGSGISNIGTSRATETTPTLDPKTGARVRDKNGIPYAAPISPPGAVQEAYDVYREARAQSKGLNFIVNFAQSMISVVQAIYGNYGGLVTSAKSWYDTYSKSFPKQTDQWEGVVPPSPLVQRRIPTFGFVGAGIKNSDERLPYVPRVGGSETSGGYGGVSLVQMLVSIRGYASTLIRFGAPFVLTEENRTDLEGIRNPVLLLKSDAPRSVMYPAFPVPGFKSGSPEAASASVAASTPTTPVTTQRSKAGLWILGFGTVAAVGGLLLSNRGQRVRWLSRG